MAEQFVDYRPSVDVCSTGVAHGTTMKCSDCSPLSRKLTVERQKKGKAAKRFASRSIDQVRVNERCCPLCLCC